MRTFKIGADPEVFVGDDSSVRSIIGRIGGTKKNPRPLPIGDGFAVQEDNVALEYNIPASSNKGEFIKNISSAMDFLGTVMKDQWGYKLLKESAISFPDEELQHPDSWVFGCDPDYNAWTMRANPRPKAEDRNLRSCGGHVHIGDIEVSLTKEQKLAFVQWLDLYLAVPSVLMDNGQLRKQLYGKAGAFRDKSYGLEYRVLSNYWIFDPKLTGWVYDQTDRALDAVLNDKSVVSEKDMILTAIDGNCKDTAYHLVKQYDLELISA